MTLGGRGRPETDQGAQRGEEEVGPQEGVYHGRAAGDGAFLRQGKSAEDCQ